MSQVFNNLVKTKGSKCPLCNEEITLHNSDKDSGNILVKETKCTGCNTRLKLKYSFSAVSIEVDSFGKYQDYSNGERASNPLQDLEDYFNTEIIKAVKKGKLDSDLASEIVIESVARLKDSDILRIALDNEQFLIEGRQCDGVLGAIKGSILDYLEGDCLSELSFSHGFFVLPIN